MQNFGSFSRLILILSLVNFLSQVNRSSANSEEFVSDEEDLVIRLNKIKAKVTFYGPDSKMTFKLSDLSTDTSKVSLNADQPFYIIVHGFGSFPRWVPKVCEALFERSSVSEGRGLQSHFKMEAYVKTFVRTLMLT
ncbi:unnamed protein product [Soboliphyme baturini]|uniref:Lipase domain-containing protein n=1 Tax=Soboliphyme baturini TaxID=241478 RepID=A0A183J903_9BILA|nr:unnamed protein product [Soboliphyme baturini]